MVGTGSCPLLYQHMAWYKPHYEVLINVRMNDWGFAIIMETGLKRADIGRGRMTGIITVEEGK